MILSTGQGKDTVTQVPVHYKCEMCLINKHLQEGCSPIYLVFNHMRREINFVKVICVQPFTFTNAGIRVIHRMILHLLQLTIEFTGITNKMIFQYMQ